jgi:hypothetical protein
MADPARVFSLPRFDDSTLVACCSFGLGEKLAENWGIPPQIPRSIYQVPLLSILSMARNEENDRAIAYLGLLP